MAAGAESRQISLYGSTTVCDVCSKNVNSADCYALTTRQVTTNARYWGYILLKFGGQFDDDLLAMYVHQQASQNSAWLLCESCSQMFDFDRHTARDYARRMANPLGCGPINVGEAAAAAAVAFKLTHGRMPSWA